MPAKVAPSASTASGTSIDGRRFLRGVIAMAVIVVTMIVGVRASPAGSPTSRRARRRRS